VAHHDQVEQTEEAQRQRRGRQRQAAPGGFHDRLIKILAIALPMATGAIVAFLVIAPFSPRSEVSFILDRDKVEQVDERLRVDNATYRGADKKGRPFSLVADEAVQKSSKEGIVRLDEVIARILLADGPAQLTADGGEYTIADELLKVRGPVMLRATDGDNLQPGRARRIGEPARPDAGRRRRRFGLRSGGHLLCQQPESRPRGADDYA